MVLPKRWNCHRKNSSQGIKFFFPPPEANTIIIVIIPILHLLPSKFVLWQRSGYIVECDAVLVSGSAVANESMLTGESIPVTKVNADNDNHENCDNIQGNKNYNGGGIANESMHTGDLVVLQWRK